MRTETTIEQLLRWHLSYAEEDAPPAPRAARLLALARPWWETWPERFQAFVARLDGIQVAYGHAMSENRRTQTGHPIPGLVVHANREVEALARVLYWNI